VHQDEALAETVDGALKAAVIHRRGPWRSVMAVACAIPEWIDRDDHRRFARADRH
jgi:putative transposase